VCEAVAGGTGLDDGGVVGEPVDDRGAQAGVGEGLGPAAEGFVGRDCDGGLLFAFGEDLEEEFGATPVELEVAQFIQTEQVDPAVAGDDFGEGAVVLGFGEFVDESGGEDVVGRQKFSGLGYWSFSGGYWTTVVAVQDFVGCLVPEC